MEYIYVRTTHVKYVTPEWAEGRAHSVLHVDYAAYSIQCESVSDHIKWLESLPSKLLQAYAADYERWHSVRPAWERQQARNRKWLKRRAQRVHSAQQFGKAVEMEHAE